MESTSGYISAIAKIRISHDCARGINATPSKSALDVFNE